jgi:hypothetical protein
MRYDLLLRADDQQPLKPVSTKPMKFALKSQSVIATTTAGQIRNGFTFDGEELLKADNRVIAGRQHAANGLEMREEKRLLFTRVHNDHRLAAGEIA